MDNNLIQDNVYSEILRQAVAVWIFKKKGLEYAVTSYSLLVNTQRK